MTVVQLNGLSGGCITARLQESIAFYNERYIKGYMEKWPTEKKKRVFELIKTLGLPVTGDALDFGCGNGEFTEILKLALPRWNIYGMDISTVAVNNAKKNHPDCLFFLLSDMHFANKKFNFLFTHHILEHVDDINQTWCQFDRCLKKRASCLHVLPCGNQGSFEYGLCMQRIDGVERDSGNRFAFEDKSHLRRLTTKQMNQLAAKHNFQLVFGYYSNQFYGAIDWITLLSPALILKMTNPMYAKGRISAIRLICSCIILLIIKVVRFPANIIDYKKEKMKRYKYYFFFLMLLTFYPLSKLTNIFLKYMSNLEWQTNRNKENGSEMYLYYKRA